MGLDEFINGPAFVIFTTGIGFAMLVMGRQIFWIFIAGLGFALGLIFGEELLSEQSQYMILFISAIIGIVGALLAYTLQRFAAGIGGFITGWYLAYIFIDYFININLGSQFNIVAPILVGFICGALIIRYFDWGVIIASSIAGSAIIVSGMRLAKNTELILLIMLAAIGITIQAIWFSQDKERRR
jgi:hypothetical protein